MSTASQADVWIDSHCHLWEDGAELVAEAHRDGVAWVVDIGTDVERSLAALDRSRTLPGVAATVGLHPHDADDGPAALDVLEQLIADAGAAGAGGTGLVAVGECGLDYYYEHSDRASQRGAFAAQIAMAHRYGLALVIHSRDAWEDTFDVLDAEGVPPGAVFHCFTGGPDEARAALDRGASVSFSGIVSFRNAAEIRDAAALVPADRYLVETDAPYLAPVPKRGKQNRPSWVRFVGEAVAAARGVSTAQVAAETTANARRIFGLDEPAAV
ncbi:MAG: TatD family deoxyribonuclease [Acidimicrobiales bacterium]|nr:TatD family deoxyribonuclease [Acidimicrobiales bacterium]MYH75069.1 TatD family deoxyribonuclease [Acidimicrobiales bacterium]MYK71823.1 TatD family deoxyribonuclease [Acidimicrobiales bacterium]